MSLASTASNPLGYTGVNFYQNPPQVVLNRAPLVTDVYLPGTTVLETDVNPNVIWYTVGAGLWYRLPTSSSALNTLTGNSGGALSPTAGNINILGTGGVSVAGSGSTLTISASSSGITWTDEASNFAAAVSSGYYCTAALTATLPTSPSQGSVVYIIVTTASNVIVKAAAGNFIRIGTAISSSGGIATSQAIGEALELYYRVADSTWYSNSSAGTWITA